MNEQQFLDSLAGATPPTACGGTLLGVWHALRGEWHAAHDNVQDDSAASSWVHAVLHREEGDHSNASYWYRLANRPVGNGDVREEYLAIARELLRG